MTTKKQLKQSPLKFNSHSLKNSLTIIKGNLALAQIFLEKNGLNKEGLKRSLNNASQETNKLIKTLTN